MPADYPPNPEDYNEEEEDEEEEEEDEEEEIEEYGTIIPLEEIDELQDGPSTHYVGGFSITERITDAISAVKYTTDRILIFPGEHGGAKTKEETIVLDEARLKGLRIEGVPYSLAGKGGYPQDERIPAVDRRVGPWFTFAAAANVTAGVGTYQGGGVNGSNTAKISTSMASSVYSELVTRTRVDAADFPVIASKFQILYTAPSEATEPSAGEAMKPLMVYTQEPDEEEDEESDDDQHNDRGRNDPDRGSEDDDDDEEEDAEPKPVVSIAINGLCLLNGVELMPLTRAAIRHCVMGAPSTLMPTHPITYDTTVVAHPLTEAVIERSIIYGGHRHIVYAFPRSMAVFRSCILDGPSLTTSLVQRLGVRRDVRHKTNAIAILEVKAAQREATASRTVTTQRLVGAETGELANFVIPAETACEVALMCDDADLTVEDCMIANTRLGVLMHEACTGLRIVACDVRSVKEVGLYSYGLGGCGKFLQSSIRACGRECVLIEGPTEDVAEATLQEYKTLHGIVSTEAEEEEEEEPADDEEEPVKRRPIYAQHPSIRQCTFCGHVRLQGSVRDGAIVDNIVEEVMSSRTTLGSATLKVPAITKTEKTSAAAAVADNEGAANILEGPNFGIRKAWPLRGFQVLKAGERRSAKIVE